MVLILFSFLSLGEGLLKFLALMAPIFSEIEVIDFNIAGESS